jgi:hypothetical protein
MADKVNLTDRKLLDVPHYVIRAPEPCQTAEDWEANVEAKYGLAAR